MKDFQIHTFPNGIRLIHKQVSETRITHCGYIIDAGSRDEAQSKSGLAHFLEHMLFKGTEKRKYHQILNRLEVVGGDLNAYTTKDKTCVYASIVDDHTERAVELLTDITFYSNFPQAELEKEKKVIAEEIAMYEDTPEETIFDEYQELSYPDHILGTPILGTRAHLKGFNREDLFDFRKKNYATKNIIFSFVGRMPFQKVIKMLEKYMEAIPESPLQRKRLPCNSYVPFNKVKETSQVQTYCLIGNLAYSGVDPKRYALLLLTNLLGGPGLNSRLNLTIREKYGYAYNVESNYFPFTDSGLFNIFIGMDKENLAHCLELTYKELKGLRTKKLSPVIFGKYMTQFTNQVIMAEESKSSLMLALGKALVDHDRADTMEEVLARFRKLTPSDIMEVANEIFDPHTMSSLTYIPK